MKNVRNHVQLIGRLGRDPEIKTLESGRKVARVSLATHEIFKNARGEKVVETQWHNLVTWGKSAENMEQILKKGNRVAIEGKLIHRSYEDEEGNTKYISEVVVNQFLKLTKKEAKAA